MSEEREIDQIVEEEHIQQEDEEGLDQVSLAAQEIANLLSATGDSFGAICAEIEAADSKPACRAAFRRFNSVIRIFLLSTTGGGEASRGEAICSLGPSDRFREVLNEHSDINEAIVAYKELILKDLAILIRSRGPVDVISERGDDRLFTRLLPQPAPEEESHQQSELSRAMKRSVTAIETCEEKDSVPKKKLRSSIPALRA